MSISGTMHGICTQDVELLRLMDSPESRLDPSSDSVEALWSKTRTLLDDLGAKLFGDDGFHAALWPDTEDDELLPFLWGRLKRRGREDFATHIGLFVSPGFCNLSLDLEKDLIDAGTSAETLDDVVDFFRSECGALITSPSRPDLVARMDTKNVVPAAEFGAHDFDDFLRNNRDAGHPWPKVGYLLNSDDVVGFGNGFVQAYGDRAALLVPVYDAAMAAFDAKRRS